MCDSTSFDRLIGPHVSPVRAAEILLAMEVDPSHASGEAVVKTDERLTAVSRGIGANILRCEV
jgi:hypothetical protein